MLSNKNIVVTGCLQGIGKATLEKFAKNGANVFACAYQQNEEFERFCDALATENGVQVIPIYFDMADITSVKEAAKTIQKSKMEIHGLVNIAGINRDAYFNMITYQDMVDTFQVNVYSQIILSQYIVKLMQRYKTEGSIVFTSSITALDGNAGQVTYGASKAALLGAMRSMALELGTSGIRVNAVCPGVIKTPMTEKLSQEVIESKEKMMEIPRLGEANEVADVFMYLMSDLSTHISGQTIRVDGGIR
ncbi:MAG: SDR family oxidoreductase [Lachnospiraceae bacterium]|nr:SDR family oxidoreductase [Lachnospiraceae bacterium]